MLSASATVAVLTRSAAAAEIRSIHSAAVDGWLNLLSLYDGSI